MKKDNLCPENIKNELLDIMHHSFLVIRAFAQKQNIAYAISDHAHNIPDIIKNYDLKKVMYYLQTEKQFLIAQVNKNEIPEPIWEAWKNLENLVSL